MKTKHKAPFAPACSPYREPIAIVGMSCRFPQAQTLNDFWDVLRNGKDTVIEIPAERWNISDYYDPDPSAPSKTNQRQAALLNNIHDFDPLFFSISPAEAIEMNPSQKLVLELVWEAIENSTIPCRKIQGTKTGVYVGNIWNDFEHQRKHKNATVTSHSAMGQSANIIANRVSFAFGFNGPSLVVDTGCSSSLVALHLACQSLWDESIELALAAGVNHILDPDQYVLLTKFGGLSSKGKCSTFDAGADGFVRGEGAGVLLLKRLSQAEKDRDKIYAVVRGTAVNNNGYNVNLPATSVKGQKQVLADAYAGSGILPAEVHYVEAHGTGTRLGDPTETRALGEFFREGRKGDKLHIGSVKTNIGHLEAAAGIAGLIKTVLAIQHNILPPNLHFSNPNPDIPFEELQLHVQHEAGPWPVQNGETRKAGINSFGWGGTNAHTVIEEYKRPTSNGRVVPDVGRYCLPLSAKSPTALKDYARAYADVLRNASSDQLPEICIASAIRKPAFEHRTLFTGNDSTTVLNALEEFIQDDAEVTPHEILTAKDRIVMVFPGQGSQWLGMGKELFRAEAVFRDAIEACDRAFSPFLGWSLIAELHASPEESRLSEINVIQPLLCAVQIALAKLWMSWGIKPHTVVGHSMGEVAAAHISGAMTLEATAQIICTRSSLMRTVSGKGGAMAVTELSAPQAEALIQNYPGLSVAVSNSPKSTVLAGDQHAIDRVLAGLESQGLFGRLVKVDVASHSAQMDPLKSNLYQALKDLTPVRHTIPMYSTVRNKVVDGDDLQAGYWVENLRGCVQFAAALKNLMQDSHTVFIEVSPHPVLINAIQECAAHYKTKALTIASLYRDKPEQDSLYTNLGELYARGYNIDWEHFYKTTHVPDVPLPCYPFQRERYELEDRSHLRKDKKDNTGRTLLGTSLPLAETDTLRFWETEISVTAFPYLKDHQVNEAVVLPGAAYVEMMLEASGETNGNGSARSPVITQMKFIQSVTIPADEAVTIQVKREQKENDEVFRFFRKATEGSGHVTWELLAEARLSLQGESLNKPAALPLTYASDVLAGCAYYESLKCLGLHYGGAFQSIRELQKSDPLSRKILFRLRANDAIRLTQGNYKIHPALLDACFQPLFYAATEDKERFDGSTTFLAGIHELCVHGVIDPTDELWGIACLHALEKNGARGVIHAGADISLFDPAGNPVMSIKGLQGRIIDTGAIRRCKERLSEWLYKIRWTVCEDVTTSSNRPTVPSNGRWVVLGDPHGVSTILVEKMEHQGLRCIHVTPGQLYAKERVDRYTIAYSREEDYGILIKELFRDRQEIEGILHVASLSYTWQDPSLTADVIEARQIYGSISLLHLHRQLTAQCIRPPRLIVVTNGVHSINEANNEPQIVHGPLWGLTRVMFNELPQYCSRYIDLSANPAREELDRLIAEIQNTGSPDHEVAIRRRERYVPRLFRPRVEEVFRPQQRFSPAGTYIVTGFRGIGFVFIEWMIRKGARNFALLSRTGEAPGDVLQRIADLETQGCRFSIHRADAGDYEELKNALEQIEAAMPPVKGVIHAAGVIEARSMTDSTPSGFLRVLNPKVRGAWNLHMLTRRHPLECFIMFSSASTLIGLSGQGSYVAANASLDILADIRRRMGLPALSVNWGVIRDVGMVANDARLEQFARAEGLEPISMQDAMEVFDAVYDNPEHSRIGILKLNRGAMATYYPAFTQTPYFKDLQEPENKPALNENNMLFDLMSLHSTEERIAALQQLIIRQVALVVKASPARIKPGMTFKGLGVDSLMAIQLRNLLEKEVATKLPVNMFWTHPTIHEYALRLNSSLAECPAVEQEQTTPLRGATAVDWFVVPAPKPGAAFRVFCFHDAGGSAALFHSWAEQLGDAFEVVAVELPGRGRRASENPYTTLEELMCALKPALLPLLDKPFVFFGHSMGGVIAFELARELRKDNVTLPARLFVSSTPQLTTYSKRDIDHTLSVEELIALFPHLHQDAIGDAGLQHWLLNLLRADLRLLGNYRYHAETPLEIPIVVLHGSNDPRVKRDQAEKWTGETFSSCLVISRPGGHRYIDHDSRFITSLISEEVLRTATARISLLNNASDLSVAGL